MTAPGLSLLGRSAVIEPGTTPPTAWAESPRFRIDASLLADPAGLSITVDDMQRLYVARSPFVVELAVPADDLTATESTIVPPYELGAEFTFLRERLQKMVWHNSYDARGGGEPIWWWGHKAAARFGMTVAGPADIVSAAGDPLWIDGGPRQPLETTERVIHHESVDLGRQTLVPSPKSPATDLAPDQLDAVTHLVGSARVIAPAGSGKTRVLTSRAHHLLHDRAVEPETITALAYNRRAAAEMSARLGDDRSLDVRTIHSLGWEIVRMARPGARLLDEREQRRRIEPIAPAPPRANTDVVGPYLEALDEVRIGLRDPALVEAERDDIPGFGDVYRVYRNDLLDRGEADHGEQVFGAIEALCADPELRARWQSRCRHLLVDEFQDLTPAYLLLIRLLAGPGLDVFAVGDDDQVIYGYAGADPRYLIDFEGLFPGAGEHALEVNYRCPSDVVEAAVNLLGYNRRRVDKVIRAASVLEGLSIVRCGDDTLAAETADLIAGMIDDGVEPSRISVLARVNSTLLPIHVALAERHVPFRSTLSDGVLERTLLRAALAWVRITLDTNSMTRNDLFDAIRRPQRGITRLFGELIGRRRGPFSLSDLVEMSVSLEGRRAERWNGFCEDILLGSRSTGTTSSLIDTLADDVGLERAASALDAGRTRADRAAQSDDLTALRRVASTAPAPADLEPWLRARLAADQDVNGVTLSTVHRVKGLEWDHVFVFGADEGSMPHTLSSDIEEERRVFHVALTRGRESATVVADSGRPSRFLSEIDGSAPLPQAVESATAVSAPTTPDLVVVAVGDQIGISGGYSGVVTEVLTTGVLLRLETGATMAVPWGERVVKGTAKGRLSPRREGVDAGLVDRLREWRLEQARRQGVPAYVVFNDRTLEELASLRPTTEAALLGVTGIGPAKLDSYGDDLLDLLA